MPPATLTERPLRADARRNRERVLAAARQCFADDGLDAQIDDVARSAGLGVGTIYRHFPTKDALVEALAEEYFKNLAEAASAGLDEDDAWEGFAGFMRQAAELQADDRALAQVMAARPDAMCEAATAREDLPHLIAKLVARAHKAGVLRRDVKATDIPMIACGVGRAGQTGPPGDWRRYLQIVLDGLRAPAR
jgi:AcrR family transcriptional regulator